MNECGKKPLLFTRKEGCCGCMACVAICPKDAVSIYTDGEGFLYPNIVDKRCVRCHMCENVCIFDGNKSSV